MCIGKNVRFTPTNSGQKFSLRGVSFSIRPVNFGNQK